MTEKQLQEKAIKIWKKDYVLVSDRVLYFNEAYPNGSIRTEIVRYQDKQVIVKATIYPDTRIPERKFNAYSQEREDDTKSLVNKTSALENAETSAVGRALAMMGIGVVDTITSVDELNKAKNREKVAGKIPPKVQGKEPSHLTRLKKHIMEKLPVESKKLTKEELMEEADRYIERETWTVTKIKDLTEEGAKALYLKLQEMPSKV